MEENNLLQELVARITAPAATPIIGARSNCAALNLPKGGVIILPGGDTITLTADAAFRPVCTPSTSRAVISNSVSQNGVANGTSSADDPQFSDFMDPFYESTFPQCYALAATTVVAYTLVIMLFISPRAFLDGEAVVLGRRGFTNGGNGTNIGGRPWLQKVAALTVAVSLTIASANTFRVAEVQYSWGIQNASALEDQVLQGTELQVIRIISDTFLWLAQAQTLIRLFPRQREKVIIKWTAFALITLDVLFQCLNSFMYTTTGQTRPRDFTDAIPALSYLLELALGVLYAAWVIYYSLMKKRYAFYHAQMRNICVVAVLALLAVFVPIVFFILDVSRPQFTVWGEYVRWVGAAAASVIVWEWVERIEALERDEKKDGILGREVFDGDEMLELTQSDFPWPRRRKRKGRDGDGSGESGDGPAAGTISNPTARGGLWPGVSSIATVYRPRSRAGNEDQSGEPTTTEPTNNDRIRFPQPPLWQARPPQTVSPVSRTDTVSADSTVYAVRYQPPPETGPGASPSVTPDPAPLSRSNSAGSSHPGNVRSSITTLESDRPRPTQEEGSKRRWRALAPGIPLPRLGRNIDSVQHESPNLWDFRARLEDFAVTQAEKVRDKIRSTPDTDSLPIKVIPAPARQGAALAQVIQEEELESRRAAVQREPYRIESAEAPTSGSGSRDAPASLERAESSGSASSSLMHRPNSIAARGVRDTAPVGPAPAGVARPATIRPDADEYPSR